MGGKLGVPVTDSELREVGEELVWGGREEFNSSLSSLTITSVLEWNLLLCRKMGPPYITLLILYQQSYRALGHLFQVLHGEVARGTG